MLEKNVWVKSFLTRRRPLHHVILLATCLVWGPLRRRQCESALLTFHALPLLLFCDPATLMNNETLIAVVLILLFDEFVVVLLAGVCFPCCCCRRRCRHFHCGKVGPARPGPSVQISDGTSTLT